MADTTLADALSLITKVSADTSKRLTFLEKILGKGGPIMGDSKPVKPRQVVKKADPVIVTDFGRKAEKDLQLALKPSDEEDKDPEKKSGFGFIKKLIGPALLVLGGLAALVTGLMSDGPLKGLLNILSKSGIVGGIKLFEKMASKQIGKFTAMFAKILPKNLFDNVIKSAKGFLGDIGKFLLAPFKKLVGKGGAKALFGTIGKLFTKTLTPIIKRIPGIGSLISWGFAVSRFKKGDIVGGLIDVASGIATLFPGIGTGISIGLDVLNAFLDMKKDPEEVKPKGEGFNLGKFFGNIKDKILNNFPIKNLMEFYSGVSKVMTGNFKEGFAQMAFAIPFFKPLSNFLFSEREEVDPETGVITKKRSLISAIKDSVIKKLQAGYKKMPKWLKWGMEKVLPESVIKMVTGGELISNEEDGDIVSAESTAEPSKKRKRSKRENGGSVTAGMGYLVGEGGPELFVPESNDKIIDNKTTMEALGSGAIVKASIQGNELIKRAAQANNSLLEAQIDLLRESTGILREIAEKTGTASANIISNNNTSVTNMNSHRNLRDLQEIYV